MRKFHIVEDTDIAMHAGRGGGGGEKGGGGGGEKGGGGSEAGTLTSVTVTVGSKKMMWSLSYCLMAVWSLAYKGIRLCRSAIPEVRSALHEALCISLLPSWLG